MLKKCRNKEKKLKKYQINMFRNLTNVKKFVIVHEGDRFVFQYTYAFK